MSTPDPRSKTGSATGRKPRRGRPMATEPTGDELRELIIAAAGEVYARHGYAGSTVEQILQAAGVSRPTFYRYFEGRHDVLDLVIGRVNDVLAEIVTAMTADADNLENIVGASIDAYFEWGARIGPMVRSIYEEIHNPASPASAHRQRILGELSLLFQSRIESLGRPHVDTLMYDTLLHVIEHAGHGAFWPKRETGREMTRRRGVIARILLSSLALPGEYGQLPPLEGLQR